MFNEDEKGIELEVLNYIQSTRKAIRLELKEYPINRNDIRDDRQNMLDKLDELTLALKKGSIDRKLFNWFQINMPPLYNYLCNKDEVRELLS